MKIKTSELTDEALDWAVLKAQGHPVEDFNLRFIGDYAYSTDWALGGALIERGKILVAYDHDTGSCEAEMYLDDELERMCYGSGSTYLIAAMRCFVASKLGDEVETPNVLLTYF